MRAATEFRKLPQLSAVPHPFPYQGSKRALAHAILPLIPGDVVNLVEPFAGSAAVSIAARHADAVRSVHLRDVNGPLTVLWSSILDNPADLADRYERLWRDQSDDPRRFYLEIREKFNATHDPHYLLYLLSRCVKAAVRYSRAGEFNQSADHRRLGAVPDRTRARLLGASAVLSGAGVSEGDFADVLLACEPSDLCYMDPPYQGVTQVADHRYIRGLPRREFEEILSEAVRSGVSFIISYDVVTADNQYGEPLDSRLGMTHLHLDAGRSAQATLSGRSKRTIESIYLSPALVERLGGSEGLQARLLIGSVGHVLF